MRFRAILLGLAAVTLCPAQSLTPIFSSEDRDKVHGFWDNPSRYAATPPADHKVVGLWQVRLTVDGSTWLWNYNKARKASAPPTADAPPLTEEQKQWDKWISAKIARDRWDAYQIAREANIEAIGLDAPKPDTTIPTAAPAAPGPIPGALLDLVGSPPKFAEAVVPLEHTVDFGGTKLVYRDHIRPSSPRYAYYRFGEGVASSGKPVKSFPPEELSSLFQMAGITESQAKVMKSVSILEGGFDSINTYDTGFVSVGFIQFACLEAGTGSLGRVLLQEKQDNKEAFNSDFHEYGIDVTEQGALTVLDLDTLAELSGPDAVTRIIKDKRLIAVFQRAGLQSEPFRAAQIKTAKNQYWPADDAISITCKGNTINGTVSDFIKSEAGLATLFDRKVNTGKIEIVKSVLEKLAETVKPTQLSDFAAVERQIVQALKYRKDYLADSTLTQPAVIQPKSRQSRSSSAASRSSKGRNSRTVKKRN